MLRDELLLSLNLLLNPLSILCRQRLERLGNFHYLIHALLCEISILWHQRLQMLIIAPEYDINRVDACLFAEAVGMLLDPLIELIYFAFSFAWVHLILPLFDGYLCFTVIFILSGFLAKKILHSVILPWSLLSLIRLFHQVHRVLVDR